MQRSTPSENACQVVMDRISPGEASMDPELADAGCGDKLEPWKINVLVFDILSLGSEKNFCMVPPTPPMQRYTLLRELGDEQNQRGIFTSECMKVKSMVLENVFIKTKHFFCLLTTVLHRCNGLGSCKPCSNSTRGKGTNSPTSSTVT